MSTTSRQWDSDLGDDVGAVRGVAQHLHIGGGVYHDDKAGSDERLVVGDDHGDHG
jgi:hypothetical protein